MIQAIYKYASFMKAGYDVILRRWQLLLTINGTTSPKTLILHTY